ARPDLIEVNVSCPNVESEFGTPFAADAEALAAVTRAVKDGAGDIPVSIKLSVQCASIARMAEVCAKNGADAITAINTVGPGMWIDTGARRPVLSNQVGGVSGTAILPIAVRAVYEIRKAVDLPIIGTGGVSCADDALQLILAGADAVGVGSAVYEGGVELFEKINRGLARWMEAGGVETIGEVRGRAQEKSTISNVQHPISNIQGSRPPRPCGVGESGRSKVGVRSPCRTDSPLAQGQGGLGGEIQMLPVREVVVHHEGLKSFLFDQTFDVEPGQFVMLWLPGVDEKPFSVSDVRDGMLEITAKAVGPFSQALMDAKPGDLLGLRGPLGRGFRPRGRGLVVGGGMGIAPLRMLAHWMENHDMEFRTVLGARTERELVFQDNFERMGAQFATDDGSYGVKGFVLPLAEKLCAAATFDVIYGCGPEALLVELKKLAERVGCDCQLSLERHMKCGIGVCGSCCADGSGICICREGPVLDKAQLDRVADFGLPHRDATGARKPPKEN
ncbi:MAG: dihydroorotate dehydrogenase electron transfer subunit, partial [Lentisphaerae bacterium]|nr:dihydroorotate dehydrogenase electron transfer subunit [Lentisphaerota bacterium]